MAEKNEVAKTFSESLTDKLISVQESLPSDFNIQRFVQNTITVMNAKPELQKCNKGSLMNALLKPSFMGLDIANGEGYIIAYGNEAQFQTSYKGEIKFVKKYSIRPIKDIYAEVVRENDKISRWDEDGQIHFKFEQCVLSGGAIIGAFAICTYEDGGIQLEIMDIDEINNVRNTYSKASRSKAWTSSFSEMAKKTVLRRLTKHINTDFESVEARQAWEDASDVEFKDNRRNVAKVDIVANPFAKADETEEADDSVICDVVATEVDDGNE